MANNPLLRGKEITKTFPGVTALEDVDFQLKEGEIHSIIGENGAGKSTFARIVSGHLQPNFGKIFLKDRPVRFKKPVEALQQGIGIVPQELDDFPSLSVAENLFVYQFKKHKLEFLNKQTRQKKAREELKRFDIDLDPQTPVHNLSTGLRQVLQILRVVLLDPEILILDEPTTSLDRDEIDSLFTLLEGLNESGISLIYITHRLSQLFELADRVTVLRDGKYVETKNIDETSEEELSSLMVGRDIEDMYGSDTRGEEIGEKFFEVKNLGSAGQFEKVSFELHRGEILGFFGLVGAGRTELFKTILGQYPIDEGEVRLEGKSVSLTGVKDAINHSIGYLPEDRGKEGLFQGMEVGENLIAPKLEKFLDRMDLFDYQRIADYSKKMVDSFDIVTPSIKQVIRNLSGGNKQKVLLGKWVGINPKILIVDEPTRGVDVGTKESIYKRLRMLAKEEGIGIVLVSSDLPEVIQLSDRILVMREGNLVGEVPGDQATEEKVMSYAAGVESTEVENR
ncbi:sugar ABC transporter ATP-binding protein [Candidatus Bipolaricaulota bacterium]|nr:sugar ABC transporter ATP-binding protein [Candidatus Bipolaricaulota bacterium]